MSQNDNPEDRISGEDKSEKKNGWVQLAKYSQLAFVFPAATVAGWLIGMALDRWLHTTWLYLAGLILGIVFATLFLGIYVPVMRVESATLTELFGDRYLTYVRAVPLFLPRLSPYRDGAGDKNKFDAALYQRYREYRAAIGMSVAWALLALKAFYFT